jgi:hypothetical protein
MTNEFLIQLQTVEVILSFFILLNISLCANVLLQPLKLFQFTVNGTIGYTGNVLIRVELEPEPIHVISQSLKHTVELALDSLLRLRNVTLTHARVRYYNIVKPYPYHSLKYVHTTQKS